MTATNMCSNFGGFRSSLPLKQGTGCFVGGGGGGEESRELGRNLKIEERELGTQE